MIAPEIEIKDLLEQQRHFFNAIAAHRLFWKDRLQNDYLKINFH